MSARIAFAEAMAAEFDADMSPEFMEKSDRVLARLWMFGYLVTDLSEKAKNKDQDDGSSI